MTLSELITQSSSWFAWGGAALGVMTLISFIIGWGAKFRLVGATVFTLLLSASTWAFSASYTPPFVAQGAKYAPVVFDNGYDLVVAQAPEDFPEEAIQPTLEQIAGNLKGGGRNKAMVHIRIRKIDTTGEGISKPIILGEVIRDIQQGVTKPLK